jgi:tetratricopeptide (TPR) repeat protein
MKFLFFVLAFTACFAEVDEDSPVIDFFTGFLKGIGEGKGIEDLKKCLKEAEAIFQKIKEAIELIKTKNPIKVLEGVKKLIDALKQLTEMIKPCMEGYEQIKKLIEKLKKIDPKKIVAKILANIATVIKLITEAASCYAAKKYECFGENLGKLIKLLILDAEIDQEDSPMVAFLKGFFTGIEEKENIEGLLKCVKDIEGIFDEIVQAIKMIISLNPVDVIKGIGKLIAAVTKLMDMLEPCIKGHTQLEKLIEAIKNIDIKKIFEKIMKNPMGIIMQLIQFIQAITDKEWNTAGKCFGRALKALFLDE